MKFNTRSKVTVAVLIASSAIATGAFNSAGSASASFCRLDSYQWTGSSTAPFVAATIPAPTIHEVLETIFITYAATGEGEQIQVSIGGVVTGGTGGAGTNVFLLNGTAVPGTGGNIVVQHASGVVGALTVTRVFVQTNVCTEIEPTTTLAATTTTAAPATTAPATTAPATTVAPATTAPATTAPATTVAGPTTTALQSSGGPTTTIGATTTTVRAAGVTTTTGLLSSGGPTTVGSSLPAGVTSNLPATGTNIDAIGFLAGLAVLVGAALMVVRRRSAA